MVDSSDLLWGSDVLDEEKFQSAMKIFQVELSDKRAEKEWKISYN